MDDHSLDTQTSVGEVRIGRHFFPVVNGQVNQMNLARWPPKVTFGDYTQDSDPLVSSVIYSSFVGGMGNYIARAGVDDDSYWTGTLETRFPEGATLLPLTESFASAGNGVTAFPLGDYYTADDPQFLAAFDNKIHTWNESTRAWNDSTKTLTANPVYSGVNFDGKFYIPLGANGYDVLDSALMATNNASIHAIHMIVWDRKLVALTKEGQLFIKPAGLAWSSSSGDRTLPTGVLPRRLCNFINSAGDPTIHVITNTIMYAFDPQGGTDGVLYETRLDYPKHPNQGLAAANWRGDSMYVSVGLGIHGYNGSIVTSMGPDGRYGLPAHLRGRIVDLQPEYNALLALVEGVPVSTGETATEDFVVGKPLYQNQNTYQISNFPYQPVSSAVLRWSNSQWHPVWESGDAVGTPNWMTISESQGAYRLWWGYGAEMFTQELPVAYQNPKQSLLAGSSKFMPDGELITGWFDADMVAFSKLGSHIEVNLDDVNGLGECGGRLIVAYQVNTDNEQSWKTLGEANTVGLTMMPFQNEARLQGDPFSRGRTFRRIRFKYTVYRNIPIRLEGETGESFNARMATATRLSPLVQSVVVKFQKIPESQLSWQFAVSLTTPGGFKNEGNETLAAYLDNLLTSDQFFEFGYLDDVYRVRVAQLTSGKQTGYDERGNYQVNLVQVRQERPGAVMRFTDTV